MTATADSYDVILVGGGLANGLIAWRLAQQDPQLRILLIERAATVGGNHTWSFYETDLTETQRAWLQPLIAQSWPGYSVAFTDYKRQLATAYHSLTTASLFESVLRLSQLTILTGTSVTDLTPHSVSIAGRRMTAPLVIDGRGYKPSAWLDLRWQKFVGLEAMVPNHGVIAPVIMDATVPQYDGYRFIYLLPFGPDRLLLEDTRYADQSDLDEAGLESDLRAYAAGRGWQIQSIVRRERGILPITLDGDFKAFWRDKPIGVPIVGLAAGLFHPVTGYSLPEAVQVADLIAAQPHLTSAAVNHAIRRYARQRWPAQRFLRMLNRMLFLAGKPTDRHHVLARFYKLPQSLIERFYAGRLTRLDQLRLLMGKPPVPVLQAIHAALKPFGRRFKSAR